MSRPADANHKAIFVDTSVPDSELTKEQIIARNLKVVEAHFHNENPETVEAAVALYADKITWEAPTRGIVLTSRNEILDSYRSIFRSVRYINTTPVRRFATESFVFDDQVSVIDYVKDEMPNFPFPVGTRCSVRLTHVFQMKDGKIEKEIAYEMVRKFGDVVAVDHIPDGCETYDFPQ